MREAANALELSSRSGHLGTHFDVMDKIFPLEYLRRNALVFDVSAVGDRDIEVADIDAGLVRNAMFVAFHTGTLNRLGYATQPYFAAHPQLSRALVEWLLDKGVSIIGIDCAGVRRGAEHKEMDRQCADRGAFVVENLQNLEKLLKGAKAASFVANTYPVNFLGMSGLPCRVVAETA
jgi:kynurenine formamidase